MHGVSKKGITCLDIHSGDNFVVTGGVDGAVNIFDRTHQKVLLYG